MKALSMAMASTLTSKKPLARTKAMQELKGGVGSKLLDEVQIKNIIRRRNEEREARLWEKVLGIGHHDPRKTKPKRPAPAPAGLPTSKHKHKITPKKKGAIS